MKTILPIFLCMLVIACVEETPYRSLEISTSQAELINYLSEPIRPLSDPDIQTDKVRLGELLFHDKRLSGNESMACASCHSLEKGGSDQLTVAISSQGQKWKTNTPSILNAAHNFRQSWDGEFATLSEQIDEMIQASAGMNANWTLIINRLDKIPGYASQFKKLYRDKAKAAHIKDALVAYQSSLAVPSRFDDYLNGERDAISMDEKMGYLKFKEYGCATCHQGVNIGGNMFQELGVVHDYFQDHSTTQSTDLGRFQVTHNPEDRHVFKVPSLRNVAITAPYLHDGSVQDLRAVIQLMGKYQLGKQISKKDIELIYVFLQSLTGKPYEEEIVQIADIHYDRS